MNFKRILLQAKGGDAPAVTQLLHMYHLLLMKQAIVNGVLDEDLYQELCITLLRCIERFRI
ncbi:MAG TPA: helix-turn-helix domain-containing protein [Candidatus Fimivicinus intestinavium]|nr:helix-turn-helix domain-containing protein [Candidatus Fimivicinus intestinavium]